MSSKDTKRYTLRFKFQVIPETFRSSKTIGQIAKAYRVHAIFSENGAKGNMYMESFFGLFKEENRSILWEQDDLHPLWKFVKERVIYYNRERRHSALGYKAPIKYLNDKGKMPSRDASEK